MGFFRRRAETPPHVASGKPSVDDSLPDGPWFGASERVFRDTIEPFYGSPETMARGAQESEARGDIGVALCFYRKSVDMLHTAYGYNQMQTRRPSDADARIVSGFCDTLSATLSAHPDAPVAEAVREVTHRLRSISASCDAAGLDGELYRSALDRLGATAPHVSVDDVLWR